MSATMRGCASLQRRTTRIEVEAPYDLARTVQVASAFSPEAAPLRTGLRLALRIGSQAYLIDVRQGGPAHVIASYCGHGDWRAVRKAVAWVLFANLSLLPFYKVASRNRVMRALVRRLRGLKPLRPADLFEMAIIAITEQQISLSAAHAIRARLVERFGSPVGRLWAFPSPKVLAHAEPRQLRACGLSRAKARYVSTLARSVDGGKVDFDAIARMADDEAHAALLSLEGFGSWSAEYVLVRGLGRPDRVPFDDIGIRRAVGCLLGNGSRVSAEKAEQLLAPFEPFRGLAAFYLLAAERLARS